VGLDGLCTNHNCARRCGVERRSRLWKKFWRAKISRYLRTSSEASDGHGPFTLSSTTLSTQHIAAMSSSRVALRSARAIASLEPCLMCQSRQLVSTVRRNATRYPLSSYWFATSMQVQSYATKQRIDGPRARAEVDARGRLGFYTLTKQQRIHNIEPHTAMSIYDDFVAHRKATTDGQNVLRIVNSGSHARSCTHGRC
jgi:hypothetical protein